MDVREGIGHTHTASVSLAAAMLLHPWHFCVVVLSTPAGVPSFFSALRVGLFCASRYSLRSEPWSHTHTDSGRQGRSAQASCQRPSVVCVRAAAGSVRVDEWDLLQHPQRHAALRLRRKKSRTHRQKCTHTHAHTSLPAGAYTSVLLCGLGAGCFFAAQSVRMFVGLFTDK